MGISNGVAEGLTLGSADFSWGMLVDGIDEGVDDCNEVGIFEDATIIGILLFSSLGIDGSSINDCHWVMVCMKK